MTVHVAFLRAVNVGGTGKLPMADLVSLAQALGFTEVRTYIQSGNLVFADPRDAATVASLLEGALAKKLGKPVGVMVRDADELERVLASCPFADRAPNRVVVIFLDEPTKADALSEVRGAVDEEVAVLGREVHVHYGEGMGSSKLKLPFAAKGTGRNLSTVRKMLAMAREALPSAPASPRAPSSSVAKKPAAKKPTEKKTAAKPKIAR